MLPEINKAIMNITESGKLLELENEYINSEKCLDADSDRNDDGRIRLKSFSILFGISGGISTIALAMFALNYFLCPKPDDANLVKANLIERWLHLGRQLSAKVVNVEPPRNPPNATYVEARQSFSTVSDVESLEDHT